MEPDPHRSWRSRFSYSNVMTTIALFLFVAGGTAFAAGLRKNSVGPAAVRDNSVRSVDLADGTGVTGIDVADGSLQGASIGTGSLGAVEITDGALGGADVADGSLGGADVGEGAIGSEHLGPKGINSSTIVDGTLLGADFGPGAVTGRHIDESTLRNVESATRLAGLPAGTFLSSLIYEKASLLEQGTDLRDGTFKISLACEPGDVLLSGGPTGLNRNSTVVESFPKDGTWSVRINPQGVRDDFQTAISCANQAGLPR